MQTAYSLIDMSFPNKNLTKQESFRVTMRDMDVLEFVLEMKFSTIEDIHSKFFKFTKIGEQSSCLRWARERVANLVRAEFLKQVKDVCYKTLYVVTSKGYFYLRNSRPERAYSRPLLSVDGRTFDHDQKVIQIRTVMEESGGVTSWTSERQLSEIEEFRKHFSTEFRPDAIYVTKEGKRIAFELEIARKSKDRYQQKIKKYIQLMTEGEQPSILDQVQFVCEKESICNLIKDYTELFQPFFKFKLLSDFLKKNGV